MTMYSNGTDTMSYTFEDHDCRERVATASLVRTIVSNTYKRINKTDAHRILGIVPQGALIRLMLLYIHSALTFQSHWCSETATVVRNNTVDTSLQQVLAKDSLPWQPANGDEVAHSCHMKDVEILYHSVFHSRTELLQHLDPSNTHLGQSFLYKPSFIGVQITSNDQYLL